MNARQFYISCLTMLLISTLASADEPALECRGVKSDNPNIQYALTLTALTDNSVVVIDTSTKERCNCKFRHDNYFDQSKGMVPGYRFNMAYQSCDAKCPRSLKRQINAHIGVRHTLIRAESYSTPFVGGGISTCDKFSMDLPMIRRIEARNIDNLDLSPESKEMLKAIKGVGDSPSASEQDRAAQQPR